MATWTPLECGYFIMRAMLLRDLGGAQVTQNPGTVFQEVPFFEPLRIADKLPGAQNSQANRQPQSCGMRGLLGQAAKSARWTFVPRPAFQENRGLHELDSVTM